ncbi:MAG: TolC family protein, partial [Ferruginibacter sp.]
MKRLFFKKAVPLPLLLLGFFVTAIAQKKHEFSVQQAVAYALQNSVTVKNALLDYKIQQQANNEIVAIALPQISTSGQFTDYLKIPTSLIPAEFFGGQPGTFMPVQFGTKYNTSGGIDVRQILFDGQVFVGLQARDATLKFAGLQAELTKEQIKMNVEKIYYQLVVGKQQITSIDANIFTTQKLLDNTREIFKNGFAERLDVDKVNVLLNNMLTEKEKAQWQLNAGNNALKFLLNLPQKDSLVLTDSLTVDLLKENLLDSAFDYNSRKEVQLLNVSKQLNQYNIRRYQLS